MTEEEVIDLMVSSNSEEEWNRNADEVKRRCNGYPSFWYAAIVMSGLMHNVTSQFKPPSQPSRKYSGENSPPTPRLG